MIEKVDIYKIGNAKSQVMRESFSEFWLHSDLFKEIKKWGNPFDQKNKWNGMNKFITNLKEIFGRAFQSKCKGFLGE